ncbi:MAG: protein kinase domain-containing protein [Chlamydiota bacterium]
MVEEDFYKQDTIPDIASQEGTVEILPDYVGPYKIDSILSRGGMSVLYLATNPENHQLLAVKVLSSKLVANQEMVDRFAKEAEIIALADHPNIVKLYGHGEWEGGLYIAMEFIQGLSLRQFIKQNSLPMRRALEIVRDVAGAVAHLHAHGIIHRDLKPENILVTETGQIKVIDFGIAQLLISEETSSTNRNRIIGTPVYMSPEQREDPLSVSYPSDIFSLGIIAYELVVGRLSHGIVHLSAVPPAVRKILAKALQPAIADRYQDIVDFLIDVNKLIKSWNENKPHPHHKHKPDTSKRKEEVTGHIQHAQQAVLPAQPPEWDPVDIGVVNSLGKKLSGVYYDFFKLPENAYGIIMGECGAPGAEGVVYTSVLRGMVRTLARLTSKPVELVTILNELLVNDPIDQIFTLSYLILHPRENMLSYISCGYGNLWIVPNGVEKAKKISADNIALGIDPDQEFLEVNNTWSMGDTIIINTFNTIARGKKEGAFSEKKFKEAIAGHLYTTPQKQVEGIIKHVRDQAHESLEERPMTLISLHRKE